MASVAPVSTAQFHPRYAAGEALGAEITELCGHIYAATYRLLVLIRRFDEQGYWQLPGLVSCAHWLNWQCGIGLNAAREKVRVARALADLPQVSEAFRKGELSYSKVRAITRVATAENEDYLLMIARHGTAHHVEKLVSQVRRVTRLQDAANANERHARRELNYHYDDDGSLVITARLPPEDGAVVLKALERAMDRSEEPGARPDGRSKSEDGSDPEVTAETRLPIATRRADAFAGMAEDYLNADPGPASTADRYQVVVHVTAYMDSSPDRKVRLFASQASSAHVYPVSVSRDAARDPNGLFAR